MKPAVNIEVLVCVSCVQCVKWCCTETNFDLVAVLRAAAAGEMRAALCKCDLHINVKVCRQMSRFLPSRGKAKKKSAGVFLGDEDKALSERCTLRMGLRWQGVHCESLTLLLSLQLLRFCWWRLLTPASLNFRGWSRGDGAKVEMIKRVHGFVIVVCDVAAVPGQFGLTGLSLKTQSAELELFSVDVWVK